MIRVWFTVREHNEVEHGSKSLISYTLLVRKIWKWRYNCNSDVKRMEKRDRIWMSNFTIQFEYWVVILALLGAIHKLRRQVYYISLCSSIDIWSTSLPLACLRSLCMAPYQIFLSWLDPEHPISIIQIDGWDDHGLK